jgi:hypothetical protein
VQLPRFPECNHPLIKSLSHLSDRELLSLFQECPEAGIYFTAIFCRYSPLVYSLVQHMGRSPTQVEYLFGLTWRHIFETLPHLPAQEMTGTDPSSPTLQSWLIDQTALCINQITIPAAETIRYSLQAAPPPLWCYLEQALEQLPTRLRLMVRMAQTLQWSETLIAGYLQAEGEEISSPEITAYLQEGYQLLEASLPKDISTLYLQDPAPQSPPSAQLENNLSHN